MTASSLESTNADLGVGEAVAAAGVDAEESWERDTEAVGVDAMGEDNEEGDTMEREHVHGG